MEVILPAINVQDAFLAYNKKAPVLQGTDLMVRKGNIYGLLGPSGCGKTTLLKLVIGRLSPDKGKVRVLGHKPGTVESNIPGSRVGYMPQELSLYKEFTISETLHFFGRVHSMSVKQIKDRMAFLLNFLDLPPASRKVEQLSGGQQRRVSLAVALLHKPEILILDEPTVGVDPLLRQRIWDHLVGISSTNNTTIIITTHYIEEARSAHCVGLMRNGRVLAEGPPDRLMEKFGQASLEDVFLHLCLRDDNAFARGSMKRGGPTTDENGTVTNGSSTDISPVVEKDEDDDDDVALLDSEADIEGADTSISRPTRAVSITSFDDSDDSCSSSLKNCCASFPKPRNVTALVIKNVNQLRRKIGFLLFQFLLPAIQITLFAFCIGGVPKDLPTYIVNNDIGLRNYTQHKYHTPLNLSFSEALISQLDTDVLDIRYTDSMETGRELIKNGSTLTTILFPTNFSVDSMLRVENGASSNTSIINGSTMDILMDMTNQQLVLSIQGKIMQAYQKMGAALIKQAKDRYNLSLPINADSAQIPMKYEPPVYGNATETFLDFVAPGIMCSIIYFLAVGLTALSLVIERKEGLFERSLVSGVTVGEIMLAHIATEFLVMAIQTAVLLIFAFLVFDVYNVGPIIIIIMFELLVGFTGMALGFVISTAAQDEANASQLSLAVVFPFLLISGILWPIQSMPQWLQYIAICLPLTLSVEGVRSVLGRGWGLDHYVVWRGYLVCLGWAIGFILLSLLLAKIKRLN